LVLSEKDTALGPDAEDLLWGQSVVPLVASFCGEIRAHCDGFQFKLGMEFCPAASSLATTVMCDVS
jgi:hypothetical protein